MADTLSSLFNQSILHIIACSICGVTVSRIRIRLRCGCQSWVCVWYQDMKNAELKHHWRKIWLKFSQILINYIVVHRGRRAITELDWYRVPVNIIEISETSGRKYERPTTEAILAKLNFDFAGKGVVGGTDSHFRFVLHADTFVVDTTCALAFSSGTEDSCFMQYSAVGVFNLYLIANPISAINPTTRGLGYMPWTHKGATEIKRWTVVLRLNDPFPTLIDGGDKRLFTRSALGLHGNCSQ